MALSKSVIDRVYLALISLFLLIGGMLVLYLSWLPDPMLGKYNLLPDWPTRWTDAQENDTIRTAVPFLCLGLVIGLYVIATGRNWHWWMSSWFGLTLLVLTAEAGQLTLPQRSFDWVDVIWGSIGSLAGLSMMGLGSVVGKFIVRKLRSNHHTSF